jgi:hypothetical protein
LPAKTEAVYSSSVRRTGMHNVHFLVFTCDSSFVI